MILLVLICMVCGGFAGGILWARASLRVTISPRLIARARLVAMQCDTTVDELAERALSRSCDKHEAALRLKAWMDAKGDAAEPAVFAYSTNMDDVPDGELS